MKGFHWVLFVSLCSIIAFGMFVSAPTGSAQQIASQDGSIITFQWAFGAIKKTATGPQLEVVTRDTTLNSGDQIKFFIKLDKTCFIYLIYKSSQGELSVLFPYRFNKAADDHPISGEHCIPKGDQWFELDEHAGQETFYLLASIERLDDVEVLINQYESADKAKKIHIGNQIVEEIRRLRKKHLKFKTYAEKPVTIIGNLRGTAQTKSIGLQDLAEQAVEITADTFFSRTFTIDHR